MLELKSLKKKKQKYHLTCRVHKMTKSFEDVDVNGNVFRDSSDIFLFKIDEGTQKNLFLDAWLPDLFTDDYEVLEDAEEKMTEVVAIVLSPFNKKARFGLKRPNADIDEPHLFLITAEFEDEIKYFFDWWQKNKGRREKVPFIKIIVQPDGTDLKGEWAEEEV